MLLSNLFGLGFAKIQPLLPLLKLNKRIIPRIKHARSEYLTIHWNVLCASSILASFFNIQEKSSSFETNKSQLWQPLCCEKCMKPLLTLGLLGPQVGSRWSCGIMLGRSIKCKVEWAAQNTCKLRELETFPVGWVTVKTLKCQIQCVPVISKRKQHP